MLTGDDTRNAMSKTASLSEIREQVKDAYGGADYPVSNPMDLLPVLPNGPATRFESGDFSMTVMQMNGVEVEDDNVDNDPNFPYESVEEITHEQMEWIEAYLKQEGFEIQE